MFEFVKEALEDVTYPMTDFHVDEKDGYLQVVKPDTLPGAVIGGRKWRLSPYMTKGEVIQTALAAVLAFEEHEAREKFRYRGEAIFGPHIDVDALLGARLEVRK